MESITNDTLEAYYSYDAGYNDAVNGLAPQFEDNYYFRGYSDRLVEEAAADLAFSSASVRAPASQRAGFVTIDNLASALGLGFLTYALSHFLTI